MANIDYSGLVNKINELNSSLAKTLELSKQINDVNKQTKKTNDGTELKQRNENIKNLNTNTQKLTSTEKELQKTAVALEKQRQKGLQAIAKQEHQQRELIKASKLEVKSEDDLIKKTNALVRLRRQADKTTDSGRKKIAAFTKEIKKNTDALKKGDEAIGRSQRNVGNYGSALQSLPGPIGRFVSGIKTITAAAKAFIATPLGLIIAALGLAIGSLTAFFKSSEEGQNAFIKVTKVLGSVLGNIMDIVSDVGKAIFNAFSEPKETLIKLGDIIKENILNRFRAFGVMGKAIVKILKGDLKEGFKELGDGAFQLGTGIDNISNRVVNFAEKAKQGLKELNAEISADISESIKLADRQAALDLRTRENLTKEAELRAEIAEIRALTADREGVDAQTRLSLLDDAIAKENEILDNAEALKAERLALITIENSLSKSTKEDLDAQANAEKELIDLRTTNANARRKLMSERLTAQRELRAEEKETIKEQNQELDDDLEDIQTELDAELDAANKLNDELQLLDEKRTRKKQKEADNRKEIEQAASDAAFQIASDLLNANFDAKQADLERKEAQELEFLKKKGLTDEQFERKAEQIRKKFAKQEQRNAIKQTLINGAVAIIKAFADLGPIFGGIAAAIIATTTGIQISEIKKQQFAKGVVDLQGPGTETSDSIDARLSKRESVITAKGTKRTRNTLTAINAGATNTDIINALATDLNVNPDIMFGGNVRAPIVSDERLLNAMISVDKYQRKLYELELERPITIPTSKGMAIKYKNTTYYTN